ncbi:MAG: class I SAM-dependent RNA methyltransferase [Ruminococcaceae bacterium]|nr:class I SAM-dependent RNA methyltransferase [Oscillospiraceae bacterium]
MEFVATCLFGLEKQLGEEIDALGCRRLDTMDGRVTFEGKEEDLARANLRLRCAERVYIRVGSFPARSFTELFDGCRALPFEDYIGKDDAFPVKGHAIRSTLFSVPDCQSIVKKAVVERLGQAYGIKWFSEEGSRYQIEFFIFKDVATLMIDTSGRALHKRGYRPAAGAAPLRETLAAAMALTARPRPDTLIWDPFCGSGTIVIEAAMIERNIAPGLGRSFAAMDFDFLDQRIFRDATEEATSLIRDGEGIELYGSDIDERVLAYARENAKRAGVEDSIRFFRADARYIKKPDRRGTLICNPPYGERMMEMKEVEALYRAIGVCFAEFDPWQIYVLTSHPQFERLFGRRADKKRRLYNGMIPCDLYQCFRPRLAGTSKKVNQ